MNTTDRTGPLVTVKGVTAEEDLMVITTAGTMIRTEVEGISAMGRNTQGVKVINLRSGDRIADVTRLADPAEHSGGAEEAEDPAPATNGQT
jgi:DNA gyrase subunit A